MQKLIEKVKNLFGRKAKVFGLISAITLSILFLAAAQRPKTVASAPAEDSLQIELKFNHMMGYKVEDSSIKQMPCIVDSITISGYENTIDLKIGDRVKTYKFIGLADKYTAIVEDLGGQHAMTRMQDTKHREVLIFEDATNFIIFSKSHPDSLCVTYEDLPIN